MQTGQAKEGLTWKGAIIAILFALFFVALAAVAIRHSEMVTGQYISNGVPPLPAFAVILFLSLLRPILRRYLPRLAPSRAQTLLIYITVAVAVIFSGLYQVRAFLPHLVSLQYWGRSDPLLGQYARYLPSWYAPHDMKAIIDYFEGADKGVIPWHVWMKPLAIWSLFFGAVFVGVFSLVSLVQRQWIRNEKLSFPLLALPMALTSDSWSIYGGAGSRRMLFIIGFGIAAVFNGVNILHIIYPSVPSIGFSFSLAEYFPNRPWTPLQSAILFFMLEAVGIGYFVPLEVSFSTWFFYVANRLFAIAGTAAGYDEPGFPFTQEQCAGGYLAVGLILLWGLRATLGQSFHRSFGRAGDRSSPSDRGAWIGLAGSSLFILAFCHIAGFSLKLALPYFAIIGVFVLVYARIRAETGVPLGIVWPWNLPKEMLLNFISIPRTLNWGGTGSFVLFSSMAWMSRHHYPMEQAAYHLDGIKLSEEAKIPRRILMIALLCAFVAGLGAAYWIHLSAYYDLGSNMAGGGTGSGEYRATVALQEYQQMASRIATPTPQSMPRLAATGGGFVFVGGLSLMRRYILGFPFHPLGFLIATAYGDHNTGWFALMIAWLLKALILRFGGLPLYRRGMPFFLGLAIGHLFLGGVFWPFFSTLFGAQAANSYHLLFGG
ncbi:MAG: hypothetical protein IT210_20055 [Armatimonadetes bacterium]|nr:hypothetical protein [Armatimonadota bacterium]